MIGHQREILASLGIDLWVPVDTACQNIAQTGIWRDQAAAEDISEIIFAEQPQVVLELPSVHEPAVQEEPVTFLPSAKAHLQSVTELPEAVLIEEIELPAFQLQAVRTKHCVVVVDATALSTPQQKLWLNIQKACHSDYHELRWPFPLPGMQDGRGANSYIRGFLDALSESGNIISLGEIPHCEYSAVMQLGGLQEMLDQPLLKKRLWQFMQNKASEQG